MSPFRFVWKRTILLMGRCDPSLVQVNFQRKSQEWTVCELIGSKVWAWENEEMWWWWWWKIIFLLHPVELNWGDELYHVPLVVVELVNKVKLLLVTSHVFLFIAKVYMVWSIFTVIIWSSSHDGLFLPISFFIIFLNFTFV